MTSGNLLTIDDVRDFFSLVLAQDADTLLRVAETDAEVEIQRTGLVFSLSGLYTLLDPEQNLPYRDFRKLLYDSTLNEELSAFDAEITVFRSTGKTATSLYCLKRS